MSYQYGTIGRKVHYLSSKRISFIELIESIYLIQPTELLQIKPT